MSNSKYDVVEIAENYISSSCFNDFNHRDVHNELLTLANMKDCETDIRQVNLIHDNILNSLLPKPDFLSHSAVNEEEIAKIPEIKRIFEEKYWSELRQKLLNNRGLTEFFLRFGMHSKYALSFLHDAWNGQLGLSVLPAHFVSRDIFGELVVIPETEPCFIFCATDPGFSLIRYRAKEMQKTIKNKRNVLMPGGGMDPMLWTRNYIPDAEQQITIYDMTDYSKYLNTLIGDMPSNLNITYHQQQLQSIMGDSSHFEKYDCICLSGVASYYPEKLIPIVQSISNMLMPGGELVVDFQVMHSVYAFDVAVLNWPADMKPESNVESAMSKMREACEKSGLQYVKESYSSDEQPAGVIVWARKPMK